MQLWKITGTRRGRHGSQLFRASDHAHASQIAARHGIVTTSIRLYESPAQVIAARHLAIQTRAALRRAI